MSNDVKLAESEADNVSDQACATKTCDLGDNNSSLNLFKIPHTRMKELVTWPLKNIPDLDVQDLEPSLQAVYEAMWELKSHEYIENHFIMDTLKKRLQSRKVFNEAVCNCHEDSMLLEVIGLVERVYTAQTQKDRCHYGQLLQKKIRAFLEDFVTHMEQEEAVFQPLLDQNFEPQELKQMNEKVLEQHNFYREKIKEKNLKAVKRKLSETEQDDPHRLDADLDEMLRVKKSYCQEVSERLKNKKKKESQHQQVDEAREGHSTSSSEANQKGEVEDDPCARKYFKGETSSRPVTTVTVASSIKQTTPVAPAQECHIGLLPEEVLMMIFAHLNPRDLLNASAVTHQWNRIALSSALWQAIYPTQWARGCWSLDYQSPDLDKDLKSASSSLNSSMESLPSSNGSTTGSQEAEDFVSTSKHEDTIFRGIGTYLLPKVGTSVSTLILSASRGITSSHVRSMLRQLPNVRLVDLSYTNIAAPAFIGLNRHDGCLRKLEELNFSGCKFVSDKLLYHLSLCYAPPPPPPSVGATPTPPPIPNSSSKGRTSHLSKLLLSGCRMITSVGIVHLLVHQGSLQEIDLSGCYKIDGQTLATFVRDCPKLKPHRLSYCNDIEDGPYQDTANGCLNLECEVRFCCQNSKLIF